METTKYTISSFVALWRTFLTLLQQTTSPQVVSIGNAPLVRFLLKSGHHINGVNSGERTALYHAAKKSMHHIMNLLLTWGADPKILPTGRKSWEDFISDDDVLRRLENVGYRRRDANPEVERQIRWALRERVRPPKQPMAYSPEALFGPNNSRTRSPERSSSPVSVSPASASLHHAVSNKSSSLSPMSADQQKNDNKRKARSGGTDWFKRMWANRQ
jgi:hypothetical protein